MQTPKNEMEFIIYFAERQEYYNWEIISATTYSFPDMKLMEGRTGKIYKVEFEYFSKSFIEHEHDATKCDLIICWKNNFPIETDFPIWELSDKNSECPSLVCLEESKLNINTYIGDYISKRNSRRIGKITIVKNSPDWRKVRPQLSQEDLFNLAYLNPNQMRTYSADTGFTYKTISNWRANARAELGMNQEQ